MDHDITALDWSLVQSFLAVAATGSLSAAAVRLGASQPTLGRQIRRLEDETGLTLFARRPRGLELTEEGSALLPAAQKMGAAMTELALAAAGHDDGLSGSVRITASGVVSHHLLPRIIAEVRQAAPEIEIELDASDDSGNLLFREADIALRMYRPDQLDIITRCLGEIEIGCFAATGYLDRAGRPEQAEQLKAHALIGFDRSDLMIRAMRHFGWPATARDFAVRCDNQVAYWELLRAGCGIGFYQAHVAVATPGIERILPDLPIPGLPVWLAAHETVRRIPRVDLVWRILEQGLSPYLRPLSALS
ncbi:LysR family transcriptional regulator [Pseudooceanicola sp.]|uniref:LysR family transcriptional regulator n=1 Tax=Pseudooceanicola sp. TaxID=1914328 RepID=UPI0026275E55|nr:LysR family transcriptional regulator [Pseudooceanicola sp.]MDF1857209.1 LysR family transcriptional regulator [Pseudooceanicola sp.]